MSGKKATTETEHVLGRGPNAVKDRAGDAHAFVVRIRREPGETAEAHRQWRGEFQHLHEGEEVTRRRFGTVGAMLEAFIETIRRVTGVAGKSGSGRGPARHADEKEIIGARHTASQRGGSGGAKGQLDRPHLDSNTGISKHEGPTMWYPKLRTFITSLLRDESGANAVEYALIMALVAVFIIAAVILMATEIGNLFNAMANCLSDAVNCSAADF